MRFQTVLLILALAAVAVFLLLRAHRSDSRGYRRRFDSKVPPQHSAYAAAPVYTDGDSGAGVDCSHGSADAGAGCSDGGGSS